MLNGKGVLITGANGGLGSTVTRAFLDAGARVVGVSRSIKVEEFAHPNFSAESVEIASVAQARELIARAGRVDVLVHLVGAFAAGSEVAATDDSTFAKMLDLNLYSFFHMVRAVLPGMQHRGSGRVLAIGSRTAVEPVSGLGVYSASKAALVSLVGTIARENKQHGISANVILPGTMDTPANRAAMPNADVTKLVQPREVAALLVHLSSETSSQVTGAVIPIYGAEL